MPETPATVNCGATRADDGCEQWRGAEPFYVERDPNPRGWHPWVVRHICGLATGTFRYRDSAKAAAAAMNAVGERYRIDSAAVCGADPARAALLAARRPFDQADRSRWVAVSERRKAKR